MIPYRPAAFRRNRCPIPHLCGYLRLATDAAPQRAPEAISGSCPRARPAGEILMFKGRLEWRGDGRTGPLARSALPSRSGGEHAGYALLGAPRLRFTVERMGGWPPQSWAMGDFHMEDRPARKAEGSSVKLCEGWTTTGDG
jgi:hypothetical protein